jgi:hypothetical protein
MAELWPGHLDWVKVWLTIVIVGGAFILMHGLGHRWSTDTCNICRLMSKTG